MYRDNASGYSSGIWIRTHTTNRDLAAFRAVLRPLRGTALPANGGACVFWKPDEAETLSVRLGQIPQKFRFPLRDFLMLHSTANPWKLRARIRYLLPSVIREGDHIAEVLFCIPLQLLRDSSVTPTDAPSVFMGVDVLRSLRRLHHTAML